MELELLYESIEAILDKKYFLSRRFKILMVKLGMSEVWKSSIQCAEDERALVTLTSWDEETDAWEAFRMIVSRLYLHLSIKEVIFFISCVLEDYHSYSQRSFPTMEIKESLSFLGATQSDLTELDSVFSEITLDYSDIESIVSSSDDVKEFYLKMKNSFFNKNYRGTNTYAYTLLEGIFKGYLIHNEIPYTRNDELRKLAKKVKEDIRENGRVNELLNPALNQITAITEIIDVCRNRASDSHFDSHSDKIMSSFVKDLAVSVSNMILHIINNDNIGDVSE